MSEPSPEIPRPPGLVRRVAAGAWHVPAGFALLLRNPGLWPLAAVPVVLAGLFVFLGAVLGIFLIPPVQTAVGLTPGAWPVWVEIPATLLLWTAMIGSGVFLGLGLGLLLATPALEQLSRRVEARVLGAPVDVGRGLVWELAQSLRGGFYFLLAAPGVFLLGLIPVAGPLASAFWGGRAVAFQMTDPALTRRGLPFRARRRWHRDWRPESQGFGLAGMVGLLIPFANLLLGPALVAGGTLLVVSLEPLGPSAGQAAPSEAPLPRDTPDEGGPEGENEPPETDDSTD